MMDAYTEQIIKKKKGAVSWAMMLGSLVVSILFLWLALPFMLSSMLIFAACVAAAGWFMWYIIGTQNVEYEYCVTNGDIDIDRIVAQRKRQRIVSVKGKKLQNIGLYTADCLAGKQVDRFVMAAPSAKEEGNWYFTYTSKKSGFTAVVFRPNDKVLKLIYRGLPKLMQLEMERAGYTDPVDGEDED